MKFPAGHHYKFRVKAVNKYGTSEPLATTQSIEAKNPFDNPGAPKNPEIADYDKDFVQLKWDKPDTDGGSPIVGYIIEKKDKFNPNWEKCAEVEDQVPVSKYMYRKIMKDNYKLSFHKPKKDECRKCYTVLDRKEEMILIIQEMLNSSSMKRTSNSLLRQRPRTGKGQTRISHFVFLILI